MLFLFTDGFADQTDPGNKKMGSPALLAILQNNALLPCEDQGRLLGGAFNAFKGDAKQKDDVTVIGIAIS